MENYWDTAHAQIEEALPAGERRVVFYSVVGKRLDEIAVKGRVRMIERVDAFWTADETARDYRSEILVDPTWLDISIAANYMINTVRDFHHIFLENIREVGGDLEDAQTVMYDFIMGS